MRPYFILAVRLNCPAPGAPAWGIEFGDYDRETVDAERSDYLDRDYKARDLKIVQCANARQSTVNAAIAAINAKETGK